MQPIIHAKSVSKIFGQKRGSGLITALDNVSVDAFAGETIGLVGESGSGKTTLARILIGIETATEGQIFRNGRLVETRQDWKELRLQVQYVFQDPFTALCPTMRIGTALSEPLAVHKKCRPAERPKRVSEMLEKVGLHPDIARRLPTQLSGGQRQRVSLARSLMLEPNLLICDEIVSGLDVSVQAQVLQLLIDLQRDLGISIIFISHDLRVIQYLCDRVYVMYKGKVVEQGHTKSIFTEPSHQHTKDLLTSIPGVKQRERNPEVQVTS